MFAKGTTAFRRTHVVVATPAALAEVLSEPEPVAMLDYAKAIVVDEVDDCFLKEPEAMQLIMQSACSPNRPPGAAYCGRVVALRS